MSFGNTKSPLKPTDNSKQRYVVPKRRNPRGPMEFYLPDDMVEQFKKHAAEEMTRTVMQWYGISFSTFHRFKRELGVMKDMVKVRHKQAQLTKRICKKNGYYEYMRGKQLSEQCKEAARKLRESGFHPMKRLKEINPRRYKRVIKKKGEARKQLIARERRRYNIGLMPITDLPTHIYSGDMYTRTELAKRNSAKRRGYILGSIDPDLGERMMLFYTDKTRRAPIFEHNCIKAGFEIRSLASRGKILYTEENRNALLSE